MSNFIKCFLYLATMSLGFFFIGRLIPKSWLNYSRFPFQPFRIEKGGDIYRKIGIQKWQNKLPDMSKVFSNLMPPKKLPKVMTVKSMERMVLETCIAEFIHGLLCIMGLGCPLIWNGIGGWILFICYMFGNLPFIFIQRYNRPKLIRLLEKVKAKDAGHSKNEQEITHEKGSDIKLQHRAGA